MLVAHGFIGIKITTKEWGFSVYGIALQNWLNRALADYVAQSMGNWKKMRLRADLSPIPVPNWPLNQDLRVAKYNPKLKWGVWYTNELYYSSAYQALTLSARNLLHCLMSEVDVKSAKSRNRTDAHKYPNNGKISVTQSQFISQFHCVKQSYINARNLLIKVEGLGTSITFRLYQIKA